MTATSVRDKWPLYSKRSRDGFMGAVIIANNVTLLATAEFPYSLLCPFPSVLLLRHLVRFFRLFWDQPTPDISNHHSNTFLSPIVDGLVVSCDLPNALWTVAKKSFWLQYLSWAFGRCTNYEMVKNAKTMPVFFHPSWPTTWNSLKVSFGMGGIDCWLVWWRIWRCPLQPILIRRHCGIGDSYFTLTDWAIISTNLFHLFMTQRVYFSIYLRKSSEEGNFSSPSPCKSTGSESNRLKSAHRILKRVVTRLLFFPFFFFFFFLFSFENSNYYERYW